MSSVNLMILNYNSLDLLKVYLPLVKTEAKNSVHDCVVTVVDNNSHDGSEAWIRKNHADVKWCGYASNRVLSAFNPAVLAATETYVILLNNDMGPQPDFVDPLIHALHTKEDAFFASTHGDRPRARVRWGVLGAEFNYPGYTRLMDCPGYCFSAGVAAFNRKMFLELEGYDSMYLPGRYEDVDLCFRAWRRGWKGYYVPESKKTHEGGTSFKRKYTQNQIAATVFRNGILFTLKNITSPVLLLQFVIMIPLRLITGTLLGKFYLWKGLKEALRMAPEALKKRKKELAKDFVVMPDHEIFFTVNNPQNSR